ncbi:MAG: phospholipid transport system substrate-binding protein [Alteromonadaceae bacterium]|jgi:phospholipid transport system substrate-binding protein
MTKSITTYFVTLLALITLLAFAPAQAITAQTNPYQMIQQVADTTFKRINQDQSIIKQDPNHLKAIVIQELMPYIDSRYAAKVVLYKIKASKADKEAFYQAFEQYLITIYATVFAKYTDQEVVFDPAQSIEGKRVVTVKSRLVEPGNPDINIDFKVRKDKKTGQWKAYDLRALGVSLLDSKKAELKALLRKQDGVSNVAKRLLEKANANIIPSATSQKL